MYTYSANTEDCVNYCFPPANAIRPGVEDPDFEVIFSFISLNMGYIIKVKLYNLADLL